MTVSLPSLSAKPIKHIAASALLSSLNKKGKDPAQSADIRRDLPQGLFYPRCKEAASPLLCRLDQTAK